MILFDPTVLLPKPFRRRYTVLRVLLLLFFVGSASAFAYRTLFPSQEFTFSFENPDTSKNTLEEPAGADTKALRKGHITANETLKTYAGTVGSFSSATIRLTLERNSPAPESPIIVSLRKSYRSFFYPDGNSISSLPKERGFLINGVPYLFSNGTLSPFISDAAALSWFAKDNITTASEDLLKLFPVQEEYAGFRPGALLSDAQGVYAVSGDKKVHPIGSTDVFKTLGFNWKDVVPISEEELRVHARGKILLFDAAQPDGTLFADRNSGRSYLVENGTKREVQSQDFLDSLHAVATPIEASSVALEQPTTCELSHTFISFWPFRREYDCTIPIETLKSFPGGSFEIALDTQSGIHAATLDTTFTTNPDRENLSLFFRQIRDRFSAVYGKK